VPSRFFMAVVAAAALVALAEPSASAARFASESGESAAQCSGGTLLTAVSAHRLPAGSTAYTYKLPDGTSFENIAPPPGFNVATASNALLTELNLPERPAGAAARKAWEAQVAPFGKFGISGTEKFCESAGAKPEARTARQHAVSMQPLGLVGESGDTSFAGYELRSGPYQKATADFKQPSVAAGDGGTLSNWIGLNGTGSGGRLIQAGAESPLGTLFWELYCAGGSSSGCTTAQIESTYTASAGDEISISVSYNPDTLMSYYAVSINGVERLNVEYQMQSGSNSGNVADFITERPAGSVIPSFTSIQFTSSQTYTVWNSSDSVPFGSQGYFAEEMTDNGTYYAPPCSTSTHIMIYPDDVTSGGFLNNFCHAS